MRTCAAALALWLASAAQAPDVADPYDDARTPALRGVCESFRKWKVLMQREYPHANRSTPGMARICAMKDD